MEIIDAGPDDPLIDNIAWALNAEWGVELGYSVSDTTASCRDVAASSTQCVLIAVAAERAIGAVLLVPLARDRLADQGIVINGLAIMIDRQGLEDYFHLANLDEYFEDCVIGGPGAFVIRITDQDQFATAIRRKMILEIADAEPRISAAAAPGLRAPVDCLIGEQR